MVHHIVMWKFKPEIEEARKPELKNSWKIRSRQAPMMWRL